MNYFVECLEMMSFHQLVTYILLCNLVIVTLSLVLYISKPTYDP